MRGKSYKGTSSLRDRQYPLHQSTQTTQLNKDQTTAFHPPTISTDTMAFKTMMVAALAALPAVFASPIELESRAGCKYNGGWQNFPSMNNWLPWTTVFGRYQQDMVNAGSTWDDVGRINVAISNAASTIGVDERVILAIILQESHGYVGVQCTGNNDCGLMQCEGCPSFQGRNGLPQVCRHYTLGSNLPFCL